MMEHLHSLDCAEAFMAGPYNVQDKSFKVKVITLKIVYGPWEKSNQLITAAVGKIELEGVLSSALSYMLTSAR